MHSLIPKYLLFLRITEHYLKGFHFIANEVISKKMYSFIKYNTCISYQFEIPSRNLVPGSLSKPTYFILFIT